MSTYEQQKPSVPTGSPPTTRFCLVRHGTTDWNRENRIQGRTDTPLNEQGQREISQLAVSHQGRRLGGGRDQRSAKGRGKRRDYRPDLKDSGVFPQRTPRTEFWAAGRVDFCRD